MKINTFIKACIVEAIMCIVFPSFGHTKAEEFGWRLGIQSYSFRNFTVLETLEKTKNIGIKYIEIFSSQKVGGEFGDAKFDYKLDRQSREKIKNIFNKNGVKISSIGVFDIYNTPTLSNDWELVFQFARDMGVEYISCEPPSSDMKLVEQLVKKYNIKVAIHNHQNPSKYWNPDAVMRELQNRDRRIGCCGDIAHWKNSGLDELDCIRELNGRIISLHFADILSKESNKKVKPQNVIWGKGIINIKALLEELKHQNFKGIITIEFEFGEDTTPEIKESINYYNELTDKIFNN